MNLDRVQSKCYFIEYYSLVLNNNIEKKKHFQIMQPRIPQHRNSPRLLTEPSVMPSLKLVQNSQSTIENPLRHTGRMHLGTSDSVIVSPRLIFEGSLKSIKSPRGSDGRINEEVNIMKKDREVKKEKRNTLPTHFAFPQIQQLQSKNFIPASDKHKTTRISFTYAKSQPSTPCPLSKSPSLIFNPSQATPLTTNSKKVIKMAKNRLCSTLFNISYSPVELYGKRSLQIQKLLESIKVEAESLPSKSFTQSKLTSAQTITSIHNFKDSQITHASSNVRNWEKRRNSEVPMPQKRSLADTLPSSKKLGKTILIPSNGYDFGGLLSNPSKENISRQQIPMQNSSNSQEWNQLRGLLTQELPTDLKESIHCSPDIRENKYNVSMLQGFGRQIEQSIVALQE